MSGSPFHDGELALQARAGTSAFAERLGQAIADTVPRGALGFVARQPLLVVGSVARGGEVWASLVFGEPGFVTASERRVHCDAGHVQHVAGDPLWLNLESGAPLGLLFIELSTRRRLRVNGVVDRLDGSSFELSVSEAYSNCPKYIQRRQLSDGAATDSPVRPGESIVTEALTPAMRTLIEHADTAFVASAQRERGADVSHRGGPPGFLRAVDERTLRCPDYRGNGMFNTLGNLAVEPGAGLTILDFASGSVLQLSGRARLLFDQEDPRGETLGTGRFWELLVERCRLTPEAAPHRWEWLGAAAELQSPSNVDDA